MEESDTPSSRTMAPSQPFFDAVRAAGTFLYDVEVYDVLPDSGKSLVLDIDIQAKLALYALVEHGAFAAVLWDGLAGAFVGCLTTTDFVKLTLASYEARQQIAGLTEAPLADGVVPIIPIEDDTIRTWRGT